ncbi:MAG: hypothetical protein LUC88_04385 [Prevotella sp.]|nr:hypothetical protein [Prevotella sp.]
MKKILLSAFALIFAMTCFATIPRDDGDGDDNESNSVMTSADFDMYFTSSSDSTGNNIDIFTLTRGSSKSNASGSASYGDYTFNYGFKIESSPCSIVFTVPENSDETSDKKNLELVLVFSNEDDSATVYIQPEDGSKVQLTGDEENPNIITKIITPGTYTLTRVSGSHTLFYIALNYTDEQIEDYYAATDDNYIYFTSMSGDQTNDETFFTISNSGGTSTGEAKYNDHTFTTGLVLKGDPKTSISFTVPEVEGDAHNMKLIVVLDSASVSTDDEGIETVTYPNLYINNDKITASEEDNNIITDVLGAGTYTLTRGNGSFNIYYIGLSYTDEQTEAEKLIYDSQDDEYIYFTSLEGDTATSTKDFFTILTDGKASKVSYVEVESTATYDGHDFKYGFKVEKKTTITFTVPENTENEAMPNMKLTLVFGDLGKDSISTVPNIKIKEKNDESETAVEGEEGSNVITRVLAPGDYTLSKAGSQHLFYIGLSYTDEETPEVAASYHSDADYEVYFTGKSIEAGYNCDIFDVYSPSDYTTSYGEANYDGYTFTYACKMEEDTYVKFAITDSMDLTLVFADKDQDGKVYIDIQEENDEKATTLTANGSEKVIYTTIGAGSYTLTKAASSSCNLFYIGLTQIGDSCIYQTDFTDWVASDKYGEYSREDSVTTGQTLMFTLKGVQVDPTGTKEVNSTSEITGWDGTGYLKIAKDSEYTPSDGGEISIVTSKLDSITKVIFTEGVTGSNRGYGLSVSTDEANTWTPVYSNFHNQKDGPVTVRVDLNLADCMLKFTNLAADQNAYLLDLKIYGVKVEKEDGDTNGITNANVTLQTMGNNVYYNLNGQRVSVPTHGIYILNGKKVLVK